MAKILCVLYPDPDTGHPTSYLRDRAEGEMLGDLTGGLGLRDYLEQAGHRFVATSDTGAAFERELADADIVISQPCWPAELPRERLERAFNLKLAITAGAGSDHIDLAAAADLGITVAEIPGATTASVAEHTVMMILGLVRDYLPQHYTARHGGWNIADCVEQSYDLAGMRVGIVGAGRVGLAVLRRLHPFEVGLHYFDRHRLPAETERALGLTWHASVDSLGTACDVLSLHCPLTPATEHMIDAGFIRRMRPGSYIINNARGKLVERDAVVTALETGHLAGYAGDSWYPQPAPADHPWRRMLRNGMTPHTSGTTLSAQLRYAAGVREILDCFFGCGHLSDRYLLVDKGHLAGLMTARSAAD